ncbi:hypothetical protein CC78DRAFT_533888 [Lojkania enalia]|uniref:Uncharacterized protein n=1 Tax=Lojkania enalia TaxID=147567 RepID=A0A9P4N832_9PLEO|nr:hypothetical protein CC78DRAFT_533888 [Didymosphaeria enalia]
MAQTFVQAALHSTCPHHHMPQTSSPSSRHAELAVALFSLIAPCAPKRALLHNNLA